VYSIIRHVAGDTPLPARYADFPRRSFVQSPAVALDKARALGYSYELAQSFTFTPRVRP